MRGLTQTLVLTGAVRATEMSAAIAEVGEGPELERLLVSSKMVSETQVAQAVALHTGHRFVGLSSLPLDPSVIVALDEVASVTDPFVEPVVVAQDALAQMFERFLRSDEELSELSSTIKERPGPTSAARHPRPQRPDLP